MESNPLHRMTPDLDEDNGCKGLPLSAADERLGCHHHASTSPRRPGRPFCEATASLWPQMRGQRLFLTGGTGFFGSWLTESFLHINEAPRSAGSPDRPYPQSAGVSEKSSSPDEHDASLTLLEGDVRNFVFPKEPHGFIVHAATEASARQLAEEPHKMLSTILAGTERVLDFARQNGARKLLLTSSGAVYGPQPATLSHMPEDFRQAPDPHAAGQASTARANERQS